MGRAGRSSSMPALPLGWEPPPALTPRGAEASARQQHPAAAPGGAAPRAEAQPLSLSSG